MRLRSGTSDEAVAAFVAGGKRADSRTGSSIFTQCRTYGDGTQVSAISIVELGPNGKAARQTDYFANPFPAPEWRSKWVERMKEPAAVS